MSIPINRFINVSLLSPSPAIGPPNPNIVVVFTKNQNGPLNSENRFKAYAEQQSVAQDFGTTADITQFIGSVFQQQPNPVDGGGFVLAGYWRGEDETVPASPAKLESADLDSIQVIEDMQQISDGSFEIDVDGTTESITGLDFQTVTSLSDIADKLDSNITGASAQVEGDKIVIRSDTDGSTSSLSFFTDTGSGTFIGDILSLTDGSGASLTQGSDSNTLTAETKLEALNALLGETDFAGAMFVDETDDAEKADIADWAQQNDVLVYDVFTGSSTLQVDTSNPAWNIKLAGNTNFRMLHSKANNRKLASAYMGRMHVVNFAAANTAQTMQFKQLNGITPETYTTTELNNAETIGLDVYSITRNLPILVTSGGNAFTDERYNLKAYVQLIKAELFNILSTTTTKVPQTQDGVNQLIDAGERVSERFVNNGVIAPGEWNSPDFFGDREIFKQRIREDGYVWRNEPLADQTQAERENRESPVLQNAIKLAGAIHSADVIVRFNR